MSETTQETAQAHQQAPQQSMQKTADSGLQMGALAFGRAQEQTVTATPPAQQGAPVQDLSFPQDVEIDMEAVEKFKPLMAQIGISGENAQKIVDLAVEMHQRAKNGSRQKDEDSMAAWSEAARTDTEFGGAAFARSVAEAQKAMRHFASPAFVEMLDSTGLGNHPEMIRLFCKIAKGISEDRFVGSRGGGASGKSLADILYGSGE